VVNLCDHSNSWIYTYKLHKRNMGANITHFTQLTLSIHIKWRDCYLWVLRFSCWCSWGLFFCNMIPHHWVTGPWHFKGPQCLQQGSRGLKRLVFLWQVPTPVRNQKCVFPCIHNLTYITDYSGTNLVIHNEANCTVWKLRIRWQD